MTRVELCLRRRELVSLNDSPPFCSHRIIGSISLTHRYVLLRGFLEGMVGMLRV